MGQPLDFEAMIREGANSWRDYNQRLDAMEKYVEEHPEAALEMAKMVMRFVRDAARFLRRYYRARYGIKLIAPYPRSDSPPQPRMRVVDRERARPKTLLEAAHQRDLLHKFSIFDATRWAMGRAMYAAGQEGKSPSRAVLYTFFHMMSNAPIAYAPLAARREGPPGRRRLQEAAAGALSAWVRSRIKMYPSLRQTLAKEGKPDEVLIRELPGELLAELSRIGALRLRPDDFAAHLDDMGERGIYKYLVNRVSGILRDPARRDRDKALQEPPEDLEYASFAAREELLRRGRVAGLPPREYELLKLLAENPKLANREAARHMGVAVGTVKKLKHNIKKTIDAA